VNCRNAETGNGFSRKKALINSLSMVGFERLMGLTLPRAGLPDEHRGGDSQALMQQADHAEAERAFATENFRNPVLAREKSHQILLPQSLLLRASESNSKFPSWELF
jgi:hypothetical protein